VLAIPDEYRTVSLTDLPANWPGEPPDEAGQYHLLNWLKQPGTLTVSVPSAIVSRSRNYLLHTLHPGFLDIVKIVENEPFRVDRRVVKGRL
jgi:RES domain-containing protein